MLSAGTTAQAEVWIQTTGGERLEEHEILSFPKRDDEPPFSRCFAECKEGTEFEIHVRMLSQHAKDDCWWMKCYVDGKALDSKSITDKQIPSTKIFRHFHEMSEGTLVAKALQFGRVPTVEDKEDSLVDGKILLGLGVIEVTLERGRTRKAEPSLPAAQPVLQILAWERDAKAKIASYTTGGTVSQVKATSRSHFTPIGPIYYKFQLNYRTREKLQIMNIIDKEEPEDQLPIASNGSGSDGLLARSTRKRKRTEDPDEPIYISDDDDEDTSRGYHAKKRTKYLEEEVARLRRQLKAKVIEPEKIIEIPDSDEE